MVSRSEIDLLNIRQEFVEKYDKSLYQAIEVRGRLEVGAGMNVPSLSVRVDLLTPSLFLSESPLRTAGKKLNETCLIVYAL